MKETQKSRIKESLKKFWEKHPERKSYYSSIYSGIPKSEDTKNKMKLSSKYRDNSNYGKTDEHKIKISIAMSGRKQSEEHKRKRGLTLMGKNNPAKRPEVRLKQRLIAIERIQKNGYNTNLGKNEKYLLDELEKIYNYKIIRQYSIIGYFIDGYIPELNLAIEIDEPFHLQRIDKDKFRQQEIESILGCKFLRINDIYNPLIGGGK